MNSVGDCCFVNQWLAKWDAKTRKKRWKVVKELTLGPYVITRKTDFLLLQQTKFMQAL